MSSTRPKTSSTMPRLPGAVLGAAVLVACSRPHAGPALTVAWVGSDTGRLQAPATAAWCPVARRLEVQGLTNDVAFGVVIYPEGDLKPGDYAVFDPGIDTVHRPGAVGAARWFTEQVVAGFQSDSGSVEVVEEGKSVRLRFGLRLRSLAGQDTLRAEGEAVGLVPGPCRGDSVPNSAPVQ